MKRILEVLTSMLKAVYGAVVRPSMTRVVVIGVAISCALFLWTVYEHRELSVVPLGWLGGMGMAAMFYCVDRYGFAKIDTIDSIREALKLNDGWKYHVAYMSIYAFLIAVGYGVAFWVLGA